MNTTRAEIARLWHEINREIHERMRQTFRGCEVPFGALILLKHIEHEPGVTVNELARRTGLVKSHVSKTLDQLVQQGRVSKRSDPADQRLLRVYLTGEGEGAMSDMEAKAYAVWSSIFEAVPEEQVVELVRGLQVVKDALQRSAGVTPAQEPDRASPTSPDSAKPDR